jgi:hypothetical protein
MVRTPPKRRQKSAHLRTFADIRRECEEKLAHGEHLDFDKVMLEIAVMRKRAASPTKN